MLLTQTAEYALRAMAALARLQPGESVPARELAKRTGIPQHYLSKIMRKLVLRRLVHSRRGHGGGFSLRKPPREIRFLDVLEASEYERSLRPCAFGWGECDDNQPCPLHDTWTELKDMFVRWASEKTLADASMWHFETRGEERHDQG